MMSVLRYSNGPSLLSTMVILLFGVPCCAQDAKVPRVGQQAADFDLPILGSDETLDLHSALENQPVVLVVLRGYPGYQCPICSRQVGGLLQKQKDISSAGAKVVMVYPGLGKELEKRAKEFFERHELPENFVVVTDPDYKLTNAYNLRWDAPRETAYPSTFVIGKDKKIVYAKVSNTHGGRAKPEEVIQALDSLN